MTDQRKHLKLQILSGEYGVCKLDKNASIPEWVKGEFVSITRTSDELSIICEVSSIPEGVRSEKGWISMKVVGPLDFSLTGILASLADPLAAASISIFAISTYDTDYLLVKTDSIEKAKEVLVLEGHNIIEHTAYA